MAGLPYPKRVTYRNPRILDAARECDTCQNPECGAYMPNQIVACHSNNLEDGKGAGHKAHDVPAFLCPMCHHRVDGRPEGGPLLPRAERDRIFYLSAYHTTLWLLQSGTMKRVA
ncbi:hypothetical protein [Mesoterricola sediminis]|uniref:DUF968 domain-containing protein n=1 Tax=Mesoterricola sediminis TaxID=2927980 RepID=A0AA48KCN9_9BACT|nr:hypothetical protein [Mesoterricola sediminis]BDU76250.1 hypothetical protein METESE_12080 [Mesoterricola sediminis]